MTRWIGKRSRTVSLQRLRFRDIAGVDGVRERQAFGGLHDAEDGLAGDAAALLVHAEGADIVLDRTFAVDAHGGQVVEDHRKVLIDQRADLLREFRLDPLGMVHQRVHRAQKMLVGHGLGHRRHRHGLQPAQAAELARGVAEAVERHRADEGLHVGSATPRPQGPAERAVETEVLPKRMQGEDVTITARAFPGDLGLRGPGPPGNPAKASDEGVELAVLHSVDAPEVGDDAQPGLPGLVAERLDDLQIAAPAALGDACEHGMQDAAQKASLQSILGV